ncbi:MAG: M20/M25/M40 family metallo-hydrolase [Sandaracinaceae bacterium]|nr:M20/M25/M40 family metallo-hydrolase [Sandaracinaceae bacterium]
MLTAFDTSPGGDGHARCVDWLGEQLRSLGFWVRVVGGGPQPPLIVARRNGTGLDGHVAMYGHYDVAKVERADAWRHPPRECTLADGRLYGVGVADNKGPLAARLATFEMGMRTPEISWFIQGEEETGSSVARVHLPALMGDLQPAIWLDETGYHDGADGTLRLLARLAGVGGSSEPPDRALHDLMIRLESLARECGVSARHECRPLNKNEVAGGCPFQASLPSGARYLAIGVNDSSSSIHGANESIPTWTIPLHAAELESIFEWAHQHGACVPG